MSYKIIYYCDATNKELTEKELQESNEVRQAYAERVGRVPNEVFGPKALPFAEEYWDEAAKVSTEALERLTNTMTGHKDKFFQRKFAKKKS